MKKELPPMNVPARLPPLWKRYSKAEISASIEKNYGIITLICNTLDCSYSQFYSCIKKYNLEEFLKQQKQNLVSMAEKTILNAMTQQENLQLALKAAEITLKSRFAQDNGWGTGPAQTQVNIGKLDDNAAKIQINQIFGINDAY